VVAAAVATTNARVPARGDAVAREQQMGEHAAWAAWLAPMP
jgi:hypothetical protein